MNKGKFYRDTYSTMTPESYDSIHPRCGIYHGSHKCRDGYVYVARGHGGAVKIGHTSSVAALRHRMYENRRVYGMGFTLLFMLRTHCARGLEAKIHKALEVCRDTNAGGDELFRPDDRQPWDTDTSYYIFQTYFLPMQPNERTLADAYRSYRRSKGVSSVSVNRSRKARSPGGWVNWHDGKDPKGRKPSGTVFENSIGWPARARAYDTYLSEQARKAEEELWKQRQLQIRQKEWDAAIDLL